MDQVRSIVVSEDPLDTMGLIAHVRHGSAGAVVLFEGTTRDVALLRYEAYVPMAIRRLTAHAETAVERFGLAAVAIAHRVGDVPLTESSVGIAVSAGHRPEAFEGARWLIDAIKQDVPIWKQEVTDDGSATWGASEAE